MAEALYQVRVRDTDGDTIAIFTGAGRGTIGGGMQAFSYRKRLRTPGQWWQQIVGNDDRIAILELFDAAPGVETHLDYIWEFWRRDPFGGLDWYRDFSGLHRYDSFVDDSEGQETYIPRGRGLNELIGAEPIRYDKGSAEAAKSGAAETVAKEYVEENIGPSALPVDRIMPNLTVQVTAGTGNAWEGDRANKPLSDVLAELAEYAPGDFMIVDTSTGNATPAFEFQWKENQWGTDRTKENDGGIPAVIFGKERNNAQNIRYTYSRLNEVNTSYIIGQGAGDVRRDVTRTAADLGLIAVQTDSPWARRAVVRTTRDFTTAAMNDSADKTLYEQRSRRVIQLEVKQSQSTRYGRDWDIGDLVTLEHRGVDINEKVMGVTVTVSSNGETTLTPELQDI